MKNKRVLGIIAFIGVLLFSGGVYVIQASSISDAEAAKKQLEQQKKATEAEIADLKKDKGDLLSYIEKLDQKVAKLDSEISDTNSKIEKTNKKLETTKEELKIAKEEEEKQYASMKLRIKYMYENGSKEYFELLLESDSMSDLLNRTEYIAKISAYDKNLLEEHKELKEEIAKKEKNLEKQADKLQVLQEQLEYEQSTVSQLADEKNKELAKYNEDIADASEEAKEYAAEIAKQEDVIEDLLEQERKRIEEEERRKQEEAAKNPDQGGSDNDYVADNSGDFRWPLNVAGRISSKFGYRDAPTSGASTYHKGIDISAPTGTDIVAAASGKVVTATYSSSAGNYIMIYHGNSTYTVYMHCSSLSVSVNEEVKKGQVIAAVGSTGISTGAHLHFGVSVNGSYVNPLNYVSQ